MSSLAELLEPLIRPLRFARRAGDAGLDALKGFEAHGLRTLARLRAEAGGEHDEALERVRSLVEGFDGLTREDKRRRVDEALEVLEDLVGGRYRGLETRGQDISGSPPAGGLGAEPSGLGAKPHPGRGLSARGERAAPPSPLLQPLTVLKGVGPKLAGRFAVRGVNTLRDALFFLPRDYEDRRTTQPVAELQPGDSATVEGEIVAFGGGRGSRGRGRLELSVSDGSGVLAAVWFRGYQGVAKRFAAGDRVRLSGKVNRFRGRLQMAHPEVEPLDGQRGVEGRAILPVYPEIEGIAPRTARRILRRVADAHSHDLEDALPVALRERLGLIPLAEAVRAVHAPQADADIAALRDERSPSHRRMVFDEFFSVQVGLAMRRRRAAARPGIAFDPGSSRVERLRAALPFALTGAQQRTLAEIFADMERASPMNRLLQGDVGSGKTLVALCAALKAVDSGYQAAIMAPTEILAEQHRRTAERFCAGLDLKVSVLTGKMRRAQLGRRQDWLATGVTDLAIGTHALIQQAVDFDNLGLAIIDEQHRFGVLQRTAMRGKGRDPDVLVMTATPIPRTLALTVYGDLELSVLDELPPGRTPVVTQVYDRDRGPMNRLIREQVRAGRQVYIVYPQVEESEKTDLADATSGAEVVQATFPEFTVGLVHGRLRPEQKDATMQAFRRGACQILVCTTVIEVGVDVPNATVMVVEHAERFGLSQLHQLRGRVGRGAERSYCLLVARGEMTEEGRQRLEALEATTDGFKISEVDLELRGPGEMMGTRQAGLPDFLLSSALRYPSTLAEARNEAFALVEADPDLSQTEHAALRLAILDRWAERLDLVEVG